MKPILIGLFLLVGSTAVPLSAQLSSRVAQARIQYDEARHEFSLTGVALPPRAAGARNPAHWTYLWEFGDGHYSTAIRPKYCYSSSGPKTVRVSLVPHYSHAKSETITQFVQINSNCGSRGCRGIGACGDRDYGVGDPVSIRTDANNELVPNNAIQVIVHYRLPANATSDRGELYLLYNEADLRKQLGFSPLQIDIYDDNRHRLFGATPQYNLKRKIDAGTGALATVKKLRDENGYTVLGYDCRLAPGEQRQLYLTLNASASLDTTVLKGKKGELITALKAVWIPEGSYLPEAERVATYPLKMLSVHDPNRLRILEPASKAVYVRNLPERFEVEVEYQNLGGRAARRVEIVVPWPENLDPRTVHVESRDPGPADCPECPFGPRPGSDSSCFQLDTNGIHINREVRFIYHNVMLHGKREPGIGGGKHSKGSIVFSARSNNRQRQTTPLFARITFDQDTTFTTGTRAKRWRHQGIGLKLGYNLGGAPAGFAHVAEDWRQYYQVGAYYRRSALVQGFTVLAGGEVTLNGMAFRADNRTFLDDQNDQILISRETVQLQTLDLLATTEVRLRGIFALGAGVGISLPLWADGTIRSNPLSFGDLYMTEYENYFSPETPLTTDAVTGLLAIENANGPFENTSEFGLFDAREQSLYLNEDFSSNFAVSGVATVFAEVGLLNNVALGFRQNFRRYANSYKGQCLKLNNREVYLRIKLFSLR